MLPSTIHHSKGGYRWYLVIAKRGREKLAADSLGRRGFEVYLPMHAPPSVRSRATADRASTPRPFLPGYLFVSVDVARPGWREIYSAHGVQTVYSSGKGVERVPLAVPNSWIEQLQAREVNGLVVRPAEEQVRCAFVKGAPVNVAVGPFADLSAVFLEPVDAKRSVILVSLFGRDSRQTVATSALRASS